MNIHALKRGMLVTWHSLKQSPDSVHEIGHIMNGCVLV